MAIDKPQWRALDAISPMPTLSSRAIHALPTTYGYKSDDILTWWHGRPITHSSFVLQAQALSERLPSAGAVLNLCDDRAAFVLGWAAALLRGLPTVLPSDRTDTAITYAAVDSGVGCLMSDRPHPCQLPDPVKRVQVGYDESLTKEKREPQTVSSDQIAAILYTSGSTGKPTASIKRWGSLVSGARSLGQMLGWNEDGAVHHVIGAIAPQHMFGLETTVMLPMQWGASINPARPLLPADLDAALSTQKQKSWLMMTPLHARSFLSANLHCDGRLAGAISSTMPLPANIATDLEMLWHIPVSEIYGSTETGMIGLRRTSKTLEWQLANDLILDFSKPQTVVTGRSGMPAHTLNDQVEAGQSRRFTLLGRNSDIVKVGGKRASLGHLNAILSRIPGVLDAVMLLPEDDDRLVALAVVEPDIDASEIRRCLAQEIDPVFLPRPLWLVEKLPRNDNGKLPRQALLDLVATLRAS